MEHQGDFYKNPVPVQFDSNNDGIIDASDAFIEVLGTNLLASETPSGGALYSGETDGVRNGVRYCYQNVERNCEKNGSLYSMETALNADWETLLQNASANMNDQNGNGMWDYIDEILSSVYINKECGAASAQAAKEFVNRINQIITPEVLVPSVEGITQEAIHRTMTDVLKKSLNDTKTYVDITSIQEVLNKAITSIIEFTATSPENDWVNTYHLSYAQLDIIANSVAGNAATALSNKIANDALVQIKKESVSENHVQGLCPNGFHVPSDTDWIMFEMALGMSASEAMQSGIEITNRGAAAKVVEKMIHTHGFAYSGYMTEGEHFVSENDAGVFMSSSVGVDDEGYYMWVREIAKSEKYTGVIRYKHYAPSGLSVRCFKN
jgi:uncharacterized protein (TIGR02145 family)